MRNYSHVKQKEIADKLGLTVQATFNYFKKLAKDGLVEAGSKRADYRLASKGVVLLCDRMKNLETYVKTVKNDLTIEHHG